MGGIGRLRVETAYEVERPYFRSDIDRGHSGFQGIGVGNRSKNGQGGDEEKDVGDSYHA